MNDLTHFQNLLNQWESMPRRRRLRTFMEVAGYPHYENVCSNILAFYLEPTEEHELGDLLLRALISCLGLPYEGEILESEVTEREARTDSGRKLDLLIRTTDFVVGIEAKIWAPIYNDLEDYARLIDRHANQAEVAADRVRKVVLTLHELGAGERQKLASKGFVNLTFKGLIAQTRDLVGHYLSDANGKFLSYLTDFLQTLENLHGTPMDQAQAAFLSENAKAIETLSSAYWSFRKARIPALRSCLNDLVRNELPAGDAFQQFIYQTYTLVNQIQARDDHSEKGISVDVGFGGSSWCVAVFSRYHEMKRGVSSECDDFLRSLVPEIRFLQDGFTMHQGHVLVWKREWPGTISEIEIAKSVATLLREIAAALGWKLSSPELSTSAAEDQLISPI